MGKEAVGEQVKRWREERKMTQAELGRRVYRTQEAISLWERGRRQIGVDDLRLIAEALDVAVAVLLGEVDEPVPQGADWELAFIKRGWTKGALFSPLHQDIGAAGNALEQTGADGGGSVEVVNYAPNVVSISVTPLARGEDTAG